MFLVEYVFLVFAFLQQADREGYIAIIMPRPADWIKAKTTLLGIEEYRELRKDTLQL